jgi:hypothetical protein
MKELLEAEREAILKGKNSSGIDRGLLFARLDEKK